MIYDIYKNKIIFHCIYTHFLVGGFNLSEKYEFVSWDDDIPNIWEVIIHSCSKPPTRWYTFALKLDITLKIQNPTTFGTIQMNWGNRISASHWSLRLKKKHVFDGKIHIWKLGQIPHGFVSTFSMTNGPRIWSGYQVLENPDLQKLLPSDDSLRLTACHGTWPMN